MCEFRLRIQVKFYWVVLGDVEEETVTSSGYILDYSGYFSPSPASELPSELQWPVCPDLDTESHKLFVGLFEGVPRSVKAGLLSTPGFLLNMAAQDGS